VVVGLAAIVPTAIMLWIDLQDREQQRIVSAWTLVTNTASGNSGKGPALEFLNSRDVPLSGIDFSTSVQNGSVFLEGVKPTASLQI